MTFPSKNRKNYTIEKVRYSLERLGVSVSGTEIDTSHAKSHIGIKSWGKIDFLRNHCKYYLVRKVHE
jgi:hypothetical protein